jgi:uncharacterized protein (TIGR03083 family)
VADELTYDWLIDRTLDEIDRMAWIADGADPAEPVGTCPGWTLSKLVKHTGTIHRWVTEIVSARSAERPDVRSLDLGLPRKLSDYSGWLSDGGDPLAGTLRDAGPDTAVWGWGEQPTTRWWARRMLHETVIHRADAEFAMDAEPDIDPVTAADGIDEFLANLPTSTRAKDNLAHLPEGESLHLHATDFDGEWLIRFTGPVRLAGQVTAGLAWDRGHAKATTAVRGPVAALLLFAYGRLRPSDERFTVFGRESILAAWQTAATL